MSVRRTIAHPTGGWSAIAVHVEAAESTQEGFYLTLFPDGKSPQVVFLRPNQLAHLIDLSAQSSVSDAQLWESVAKIPLEPLLPNRSLAGRLRALLVDQASAIRDQIRAQSERVKPLSPPLEEEPAQAQPATSDEGVEAADPEHTTPWNKPPLP
jgi:hypothetical protein